MAALPASLVPASPVQRSSAQLNYQNGKEYGSSPVRATFHGTGGRRLPSVHGLKKARGPQEELTTQVHGKRSSSNGGLKVMSQVTTALESRVVDIDVTGTGDSERKVVIVGAGIGGLSAAVALYNVGVKVLVLEQSSSLRVAGASLSIWSNAFRALDELGVADDLRKDHILVTGVSVKDSSGKVLKNVNYEDCPEGPHESRAVMRRFLIERLAAQLPEGSIRLNSRVRSIKREQQEGITKVHLDDGCVISTRILLGCDGVNSVVGRWLGLAPTRPVGQAAIRGMADYPGNAHDFGTMFHIYLRGTLRCGIVPVTSNKVYWFATFNIKTIGLRITDPNMIKEEILELVKDGGIEKMVELIDRTPLDTMSRATLADRWNLPGITPSLSKEGVTLTGDALHPMTPYLGQGGCTAIEDAIVLARTLGPVLSQEGGGDAKSIQKAMEEYVAERQKRSLPIVLYSYAIGLFFRISFPPAIYIVNNFLVPMFPSSLALKHFYVSLYMM